MIETSSTNKPVETNISTIIICISISAICGLVTIFLMGFGDFEGKVWQEGSAPRGREMNYHKYSQL